ncbi:hypothetical protein HELRODRAFT_175376 [Helobdella robusta]|uniref:Apple domain-containing protein n=1 Tax=Helobdella robusta TaxID=6412 RepID=T1F976_HELRO|nr:hypothetical protein HELRODRAFT_175376 [Helobdella robusta]ESO00880.1 hypothetical protein HELRODRAFT_175376 [Helobdella robusta]
MFIFSLYEDLQHVKQRSTTAKHWAVLRDVNQVKNLPPLLQAYTLHHRVQCKPGQHSPGAYAFNSSAYFVNPYQTLVAHLVVDGKNGLNNYLALCSLTVPGFEPHWIGVDLGNLFSINYTIVYVGLNNTSLPIPTWNDLNFFIVGVSNRFLDVHPPVRGTYDLCAQYPGVVASKQVVQLNCSSTTPPARYVILQQPSNSTGYIQPLTPDHIVDGFHDIQLSGCHCGHTAETTGNPNWYVVDMQGKYYVDYIIFTVRLVNYREWYLITQQAAKAGAGYFTVCELEAYPADVEATKFVLKRKASMYLSGYRVQTMSVRSAIECLHRVRKVGGCDSINFNAASKTCELNKHQNGYSGLGLNANWAFYVVQYY